MPEVFQLVKDSFFFRKNVNHSVNIVDQHPFTPVQPFLAVRHLIHLIVQSVDDVISDGPHLRGGVGLTNYELTACRIRDMFQVQDNDVLPFFILNTIYDEAGFRILQRRSAAIFFSHSVLLMLHKIKYSLSSIHNTLFTGKVLIRYNTLPSTNTTLRSMLQQGPVADGTVVWALHQTQGKGQGNKTWVTEPEQNLTFSLLYRPVFLAPSDVFLLNKVVALALYDAIESLLPGKSLHIKWPNDLLIEGRKAAGILIEIGLRKNIETAIIGIGLNVHQTAFPDLPDATSLARETGQTFDLEQLLQKLLQHLEAGYLLLRSQPKLGTVRQLHERYEQHLWGKGRTMQFRRGDHTFLAVVKEVDEQGQLVLFENEQETRYQLGAISWK